MKTAYRRALIVVLLMMTMFFTAAAEDETPVIYMLRSPAYGVQQECVGTVRMADGSACADVSRYGVIFYIQVAEYGQYYVKPGKTSATDEFRTIKPDEDGVFSGIYYSYGSVNDLRALYIHVLLVPADFTPTLNGYYDALNASYDHVTIARTEDGTVTVTPERSLEPDHSVRANLRVSASKIAVNVGFYTQSSPGSVLSTEDITAKLNAIKPFTDTVRFYSASGTVYKAYALANQMGFKVIGNAWISGDAQADKREMDALIEHANNGLIAMAVVGSETQYAELVDMDTLIADMEYVRERIPENIPVTTAETLGIVAGSVRLKRACDVLFVNSYPLYENVSIDTAAAYITSQLSTLIAAANGKQLIVSETGWATSGSSAANEADAARYFEQMRAWSLSNGVNIVYFEAFDEPWKDSDEGEYGAHWGFMTSGLELKPGYALSKFFRGKGLGPEITYLPENTRSIGEDAFTNCAEIGYLYIPASVTEIAESAFDGCDNLTIIAEAGSAAYSWAAVHGVNVYAIG